MVKYDNTEKITVYFSKDTAFSGISSVNICTFNLTCNACFSLFIARVAVIASSP